jgi:hypothetical protein
MSNTVSRVIGNTLAAMHGPNAYKSTPESRLAVRRQDIQAIQNPVVRNVALTIHDAAVANPVKAEQKRRLFGGTPADFIASGNDAAVYTRPTFPHGVLKVYRHPRYLEDPLEGQAQLGFRIQKAVKFYGVHALDTTLSVGIDPLTDQTVPLGEQAYVTYDEHDVVFPGFLRVSDAEAHFERLEQKFTGISKEVKSFLSGTERAARIDGILPDLYEPHNMVVGYVGAASCASLVLLDPVVHLLQERPVHHVAQDYSLRQLQYATIALN